MDSELTCESGPRHTPRQCRDCAQRPSASSANRHHGRRFDQRYAHSCRPGIGRKIPRKTDAQSIGLVGAGRIGALTLWALSQWFPNVTVFRAYDQNNARLDAFVSHMARQGIGIEACPGFREALSDADIGVVATTESEPYVTEAEFKRGSLFMNVSLMDPTFELVSAADKIVVDDWHQSVHSDRVLARMHREGLVTREGIHGEFGEVVAGRIPGREHPDERIFWNPFGLAIEDIAVASAIYEEALLKGLGQPLQLVDQEWDVLF